MLYKEYGFGIIITVRTTKSAYNIRSHVKIAQTIPHMS